MKDIHEYATEFARLALERATNAKRKAGFRHDLARLTESKAEETFLRATTVDRESAKLKLGIARCDVRDTEVDLREAELDLERLEARR